MLLALSSPVPSRAADVVWTNLAGGNWNNVTNCSPNQVPGVFDHAWLTNNGTYTVTFSNDVTLNSLTLGSASGTNTLAGTNALTLIGPLDWQGGVISNALILAAGGGQVGGAAMKYLNHASLINYGALTLGAPLYTGNGSAITNLASGTFDFTTNYGTSYTSNGLRGVIYNAGLLRKTGGTGTARVDDLFINAGTFETRSGTLRLTATNCAQTAGFTRLLTGGLQVDHGYTLWGGMFSGSNTFTGNLTNASGSVSPSESTIVMNPGLSIVPGPFTAQLTITGNYYQISGSLVMQLAGADAGTGYDQLNVGGTVSLGGSFDMCVRAGFTPPANSYYAILTSPIGISGCFATHNFAYNWGWYMQNVSTMVILSMVNTRPVPNFIPDQSIPALQSFDLTLTAIDPDAPPQTLTWSLGGNSPTNMTVSPTGQLHWTPTAGQADTTNVVYVYVEDDGLGNSPDDAYSTDGGCSGTAPGMKSGISFNLIVPAPGSPPRLTLQSVNPTNLNISWPTSSSSWLLQTTSNLASGWTELPPPYPTNGATLSWTVTNLTAKPAQFFRLKQ